MRCEHLRELVKARMVAEGGDLLSNQGLTARRRLTEASFRHDEGRRFNRLLSLQESPSQTMQRADS